MADLLYLDTARLGQISPSAHCAVNTIVQFHAEHGSPLYFEKLLFEGYKAWPHRLKQQYAGLDSWQGITALKSDLADLAFGERAVHVELASRTAELMKLAVNLFESRCQNVLITDLTWPDYENILIRKTSGLRWKITKVPLQESILRDQASVTDVVDYLVMAYWKNGCDGLFLPAVSNLGVKLPIKRILTGIRSIAPLRFMVVDGSQAIHQADISGMVNECDFLFAGTHKWLRSHLPLGVAFYGRAGSRAHVRESIRRWTLEDRISDPLLNFTLEQGSEENPYGETVNLTPLFTCAGAVRDALNESYQPFKPTREQMIDCTVGSLWRAIQPSGEMRSKILLFQSPITSKQNNCRETFAKRGVLISGYAGGLCRLSMPQWELRNSEYHQLKRAFENS